MNKFNFLFYFRLKIHVIQRINFWIVGWLIYYLRQEYCPWNDNWNHLIEFQSDLWVWMLITNFQLFTTLANLNLFMESLKWIHLKYKKTLYWSLMILWMKQTVTSPIYLRNLLINCYIYCAKYISKRKIWTWNFFKCAYIVVHKNSRDKFQIQYLAKPIMPHHSEAVLEVFEKATTQPQSLFVIWLNSNDNLTLRTNIFPDESMHVYTHVKDMNTLISISWHGEVQHLALFERARGSL